MLSYCQQICSVSRKSIVLLKILLILLTFAVRSYCQQTCSVSRGNTILLKISFILLTFRLLGRIASISSSYSNFINILMHSWTCYAYCYIVKSGFVTRTTPQLWFYLVDSTLGTNFLGNNSSISSCATAIELVILRWLCSIFLQHSCSKRQFSWEPLAILHQLLHTTVEAMIELMNSWAKFPTLLGFDDKWNRWKLCLLEYRIG